MVVYRQLEGGIRTGVRPMTEDQIENEGGRQNRRRRFPTVSASYVRATHITFIRLGSLCRQQGSIHPVLMIRTVVIECRGKSSYLGRLSLVVPLLSLPIIGLERPVHGVVVSPRKVQPQEFDRNRAESPIFARGLAEDLD